MTIENDFYCIAEDASDAEEQHIDAMRDFSEWEVCACEVKEEEREWIPNYWLNSLTYGADGDIKLKDWIAAGKQEEIEKKKQEELDARQLKLPLLG